MVSLKQLTTEDANFWTELKSLTAWDEVQNKQVEAAVDDIIQQVRGRGDAALLDFTNQFDRLNVDSVSALHIDSDACKAALESLESDKRLALEQAAARIQVFHQKQLQSSWQYQDEFGNTLGQQLKPIDRVGIYVPGGKASYPSSVLMNAIPAKVAGVDSITMVVPAPGGEINPMVLAAAHVAGVDSVFTVGGAQAIAALAYGTESVLAVDKIVGPGNIYVATAKKKCFGVVGIDMIAGPSEIMVVSDGQSDPDWIAMDLFSQAEHDELAQAILVTPDPDFLASVQASINKLIAKEARAEVISEALKNRGALCLVKDLKEAVAVINQVAPEHLELSVADPRALLDDIRHAGAIFMGRYTSESLGDYCAGPNHVLPTSGTARFASPLGVYDFQKRSSIIECSHAGASELGKVASILARSESLPAHAQSAEFRIIKESSD